MTDDHGWDNAATVYAPIKCTRTGLCESIRVKAKWGGTTIDLGKLTCTGQGSLVEVWRHGRRILRIPAPASLIRWMNRNDTRSCM